jgi:hypothetical protein
MAKANAAARSEDFSGASALLERVLKQAPMNRAALSLMAQVTQMQAFEMVQAGQDDEVYPVFFKSAQFMRKALELDPKLNMQERRILPVIFYNEACAYCKEKEPNLQKAIASFKDAIEAGFSDIAQVDKDPDLNPIRDLPEFKELRERMEGKKRQLNNQENK